MKANESKLIDKQMQPNAICLASKQMMPANIRKHSKVSKCKPATQVILGAK
jgi:hypothetical protein